MYLHANAKLGLAGRVALVKAIDEGMSLKAAAGAFSVSPATAHRWWHRWLEASEEARRTLSCLLDRSSRPHRSPSAESTQRAIDFRFVVHGGLARPHVRAERGKTVLTRESPEEASRWTLIQATASSSSQSGLVKRRIVA